MKLVKQILLVVTGIIYFISSTGIVIYKTNCSCIGEEQVSVFVTPETCDTEIHQHHNHNEENNTISCCAHECHECETTEKGCGCNQPETLFFKLINPVVNEEVVFVKAQPVEITVFFACLLINPVFENENNYQLNFKTGPPPVKNTSLDFLIPIHQLKIPLTA